MYGLYLTNFESYFLNWKIYERSHIFPTTMLSARQIASCISTILLQRNPSFVEMLDQVHFSGRSVCWKATKCDVRILHIVINCISQRTSWTPLVNRFGGQQWSISLERTAESRVIKFCTWVGIIRGVARGGAGASAPTPQRKEDRLFQKAHKNTRKFIHTNSTISTRCGNFDTSGSTDGHSTGLGVYVVTLRLAANHWLSALSGCTVCPLPRPQLVFLCINLIKT